LILGLNAFHGDSAAAVVTDGAFRCGVEDERLNRTKHWAGFPARPSERSWLMAQVSATPATFVRGTPKAHLLDKALSTFRRRPSFEAYGPPPEPRRVGGVGSLLGTLDGTPFQGQVHNVEHHRAHLASAFFCSPFEEAACLTVDGFGDFLSSMSALGKGNRLEPPTT
jgi:carbamoyltransferase